MKPFVGLADLIRIHAARPEIPLEEAAKLCGYEASKASKASKASNNFKFYKIPPDAAIFSNKPLLVMTKQQLEGEDMDGAHAKVLSFFEEIMKNMTKRS